jgi:hypothetical protein
VAGRGAATFVDGSGPDDDDDDDDDDDAPAGGARLTPASPRLWVRRVPVV